jgi:hypothetical protein
VPPLYDDWESHLVRWRDRLNACLRSKPWRLAWSPPDWVYRLGQGAWEVDQLERLALSGSPGSSFWRWSIPEIERTRPRKGSIPKITPQCVTALLTKSSRPYVGLQSHFTSGSLQHLPRNRHCPAAVSSQPRVLPWLR